MLKKQKKLWFAYLPLDSKGVERLLNNQAKQGWALAVEQDGIALRIPIEKTNRSDLRYHVTCAMLRKETNLSQELEHKRAQGWKPVATVNYFDIYESMPCQEPKSQQEQGRKRLCFAALCAWLLVVLGMTALGIIAWINRVPLPMDDTWYLSNLSLFLRVTLPLFGVGSVYYLSWLVNQGRRVKKKTLPTYVGMCLRSALRLGAIAWLVVGWIALIGDLVTDGRMLCLLVLLLAVASAVCGHKFCWGKPETLRSALSLVVALVFGLSLLLAAVTPPQSRAEIGTCSWRNTLSDVVHAEDLGVQPEQIQAASYERTSSLLVTRTAYWESWEDGALSSTVYQCRGGLLGGRILDGWLADGQWEATQSVYDQAWQIQSGETYHILLREGNHILELTCNQPVTQLLQDKERLKF